MEAVGNATVVWSSLRRLPSFAYKAWHQPFELRNGRSLQNLRSHCMALHELPTRTRANSAAEEKENRCSSIRDPITLLGRPSLTLCHITFIPDDSRRVGR